jgi:hypothetical protein
MNRRNFAQTLRMIWIDAVLTEDGELNRADIERAFLISTPQASGDLARYRQFYPHQAFYDTSAKTYRRIEGAAPIFSAKQHAAAVEAVNAVIEAKP